MASILWMNSEVNPDCLAGIFFKDVKKLETSQSVRLAAGNIPSQSKEGKQLTTIVYYVGKLRRTQNPSNMRNIINHNTILIS